MTRRQYVGLSDLIGATVISHKYDHGPLNEDYELKFTKDNRTFVLEIEDQWDTEGDGYQEVRVLEIIDDELPKADSS